jgi:uroporphyrin-III C-methyltransferase/precorrin-2 dehydrogenase/sirohydrochlorin ferrochelatase
MNHLPIFVKLAQQSCLVVGGGEVAERKVALLRRAGAEISVVAPRLNAGLKLLREQKGISHTAGSFEARHLEGKRLVIAATDEQAVNKAVAEAAEAAGVLCNIVDDNEASAFILPAIVDRSPVTVAIGTDGNAPVLAQRLKSKIEAWLPVRIGELARQAGRWRDPVKRRFGSLEERRRFWQRFFDGPIAERILANRTSDADKLIRREFMAGVMSRERPSGEAYIVGAGPGDPGLVTMRAQQLISQSDVILYDRLVARPILDYARKEAELISVGKRAGASEVRQDSINELLVDLVRHGRRVCRLKGGDPFVFGRGGEEAAALKAAGLPYQIVPGISAALGCAAYAGIPLTMRGVSGSVTLATARLDAGRGADWQALTRPGQTLALYMGVGALEQSAGQLMRHGLAGTTPAAIVENGTTDCQRVLHSTLERVASDATVAGVRAPSILFVGDAVARGRELAWFGGPDGTGRSATVFGTTNPLPSAGRC